MKEQRKSRQPDASQTHAKNGPHESCPFADQLGNYQRNIGLGQTDNTHRTAYIVGGGIAGLSAAYYLIRDGGLLPKNIIVLEQLDKVGGSLDGAGNAQDGYIVRGGREMDCTYENVWDLFQDIPALEQPKPYSVLDEYRMTNDDDPNYSKARLIHKQGEVQDFSKLGLKRKDQLALMKLLLKRKDELDDVTIENYFSDDFLKSNYWTFWRTMFAFENWHSLLECKLYMHRFLHALDGLNDLSSLVFPKYNQYDTFVKPLKTHLQEQGVQFKDSTCVYDLSLAMGDAENTVKQILYTEKNTNHCLDISSDDLVIVTTGSMTEDTRYGDANTAPDLDVSNMGQTKGWQVWNQLAKKSPIFGRPEKFNQHVDQSSWMSATLTCKPSAFVDKLTTLCVNDPYSGKTATGGIITITDSNWLMSFTCNRQPHFPTQPEDVLVIWVYSLFMDKEGNCVKKTMPQCTGNEILTELCHHLGLSEQLDNVLANTQVRTAYMPYITSMFMPRAQGDRPEVVPLGCNNLGLIGQFVETRNDVVFTMETSVRTARIAVYELLKLNKQVPDIVPLQYDIRHLLKAAYTLNDGEPILCDKLLRHFLKGTYFEHILPEAHKHQHSEGFFAHQIDALKKLLHKSPE